MGPRICFTDLDGTLAHLEGEVHELGTVRYGAGDQSRPFVREVEFTDKETGTKHRLIRLLPTPRGTVSYVSVKTLERLERLRASGVVLVLVTAARLGTLAARLHGLPVADAYLIESGGRILHFDTEGSPPLGAAPLREDMEWRARFERHAGLHFEEQTPPAERSGLVWDCYRRLAGRPGVTIDAGYTTTFRVKGAPEDLERIAAEVASVGGEEDALQCFYNLGMLDVMPRGSGKVNAARYVMERLGARPEDCVMLCDDQNDLQLAEYVGRAFVPTIAHPAVEAAARARPDHYLLARDIKDAAWNPSGRVRGTMATDLVLAEVLRHFGVSET